MTPQERQLIDDLFDRLAKLENTPRDSEAVTAISQGLRRAPNATYALVQTVLIQDEALKRADARIAELEGDTAPVQAPAGGFLDNMRDALFGQNQQPRGSVPSVQPRASGSRPAWNTGQVLGQVGGQPGQQPGYGQQQPYGQPGYGQQPYGQPQAAAAGGGSFLGTAAAAAAGVVGGSLLLGSIRSMMGGSGNGQQQGIGDQASLGKDAGGDNASPWSNDSSSGDLARDAGANDIASSGQRASADDNASGQGLFDQASNEDYGHDDIDADDDFGDSDFA